MSELKSAGDALRPYRPAAGWTRRDATHFLWRTQYGATHAEIDEALALGLEQLL